MGTEKARMEMDEAQLSAFEPCFRFIPLTGSDATEALLYVGLPFEPAQGATTTLQFAIADFRTAQLWTSCLGSTHFEQKQAELYGAAEGDWANEFIAHLADALKLKQWVSTPVGGTMELKVEDLDVPYCFELQADHATYGRWMESAVRNLIRVPSAGPITVPSAVISANHVTSTQAAEPAQLHNDSLFAPKKSRAKKKVGWKPNTTNKRKARP